MGLFIENNKGAKKRTFLFCFLLTVLSIKTYLPAQTFAFRHITEEEGLPSTYLYDLVQDYEGYIWLTGESGLSRYNGRNYEVPAISKQIEDEIVHFYSGGIEQLWMQDLAGRILMLEDGKLRTFDELKPSLIYRYIDVFCHPGGDTWIATPQGIYIYKNQQDSLVQLALDIPSADLVCVKSFYLGQDGKIILLLHRGYIIFDEEEYHYYPYRQGELKNALNLCFRYNGKEYIVVDNRVYYLNLVTHQWGNAFSELDNYFEKGVLAIKEDSEGDLWFATRAGLLRLYKDEFGNRKTDHFFEKEVMGEIEEDKEGNLWFITGQNGLYVLPSKKIKVFRESGLDKQLRFIKKNKAGNFILGFDNNDFKVLNDRFEEIYSDKLFAQNNRLYDYQESSEGLQYFITSRGCVIFDKNFKLLNRSFEWSLKQGAITPDGNFWMATGKYFGRMTGINDSESILKKRCYSLLPIADNKIWVGSIEGLFLYENNTCKKIENPSLYHDIRDIKALDNGDLLLATQKNGLIYYQPDTDKIRFHFSAKTGLSSDYCTNVLIDENYFWLATKKGLNRIDRKDYSVMVIGMDQGLLSDEINDIFKSGTEIYVATNQGLAVFNEDVEFGRKAPHPLVTGIKINEQDTLYQRKYDLDYTDNNIKIEFDAITFRNADEVIHEYKMLGLDEKWVRSKISVAQYPSLPPGQYIFRARSRTINSDWSKSLMIHFNIRRPIWSTWWFNVIIFLLVLIVAYLIFSEVERRRSVIRDMRFSQLTALRAQMNPHFVFNSLNSIQEFIVNKDTRSANRYLSQFARLMRNMLNFSDKNRISLSKEIESLKLYLSLESLRFGDSFEYLFEVEEGLNTDTVFLPSMLLQPFVENAIKHGLMHRKGDKKLYLRFYRKNNSLVCEIEDNGIGRKKAKAIKKLNSKVYTSKATGLIKKRVNLLNGIMGNALSVETIDLSDQQGAAGTKVLLTINFKMVK